MKWPPYFNSKIQKIKNKIKEIFTKTVDRLHQSNFKVVFEDKKSMSFLSGFRADDLKTVAGSTNHVPKSMPDMPVGMPIKGFCGR
jgi:hypothetical protein